MRNLEMLSLDPAPAAQRALKGAASAVAIVGGITSIGDASLDIRKWFRCKGDLGSPQKRRPLDVLCVGEARGSDASGRFKGVEDGDVEFLEIADVARNDRQAVDGG